MALMTLIGTSLQQQTTHFINIENVQVSTGLK